MKKQTLLSVALVVSMFGSTTLPAFAEQPALVTPSMANQVPSVPQSAAIVIAFPNEALIDASQGQDYPATVLLVQPVLDSYGNVVIPANSPVSIRLKPSSGGAKIIADSLIIRGQVFPIQASSVTIPGMKVTKVSAKDQAQENSSIYSHLLGGLGGAVGSFGGNSEQSTARAMQGGLLGMAVGTLTGMTSAKKALVVRIPQGSVYTLTLQAPIALAATSQPAQKLSETTAPQFSFRSVQQYSDGLEKILQAYQSGKVSKAEALNVIEAANTYATTKFTEQLYPPLGQRRRIQQMFNFVYAIDQNTAQNPVGSPLQGF
jgi:hypothetical protein